MILIGTRKGTVILERRGGAWRARPICHAGVPVSFAARDPRDGTLWSALDHGHWGPKLSRSRDDGASWEEAPPIKYPAGARMIVQQLPKPGGAGDAGVEYADASLLKIWYLAFAGAGQPGALYAGTIPGGLFVSRDAGESWELNRPLWNHDSRGGDLFAGEATGRTQWMGTPASIDYGVFEPGIHSVIIDPRDADHLYVAASSAGVLESTDGGRSWQGRNRGMLMDYLPDPAAEWGHDPHYITCCAAQPDHLWQQNHCGVFFSDDGAATWKQVSAIEDGVHFGFPIAAHETDARTAWVVPARDDGERMAIGGGLCVGRTNDGGATWQVFRDGLPQQDAYDIVYRHALDVSGDTLCFGTTTGNVYLSEDGGERWQCVGNNFPPVYSVRFG
ncbi:MAG: hypothetical protein HKO62_06530 [Gammaproteobacteria bacterium]|nr:hypothetical protein [Gammaproteobacteria bacterium]